MARQIGLENISIAKLLTDNAEGATYEKVEKLEKSITAKLTPKTDSATVYADDKADEVMTKFNQIDIEIELNQLSMESRAKIFGSKIVNGILVEGSNDIVAQPYFALVFKSKKSNGEYRYVCLYKGKFELASDEYTTQEDKIKSQTAKLKGTFIARDYDNNFRLMADSDGKDANKEDLEKWFTAIPDVPVKTEESV